jgi:hypothetical protein
MDNEESENLSEEVEGEAVEEIAEEGDEVAFKHRGTGLVARLPKAIRDQLNYMILDGVAYAEIRAKIGQAMEGITDRHIANWKKYGYQDWVVELQRREGLQSMHEDAMDILHQKSGATIQDAGRTIAGAQLYDLLTSFDRDAFADALVKKPELYLRIIGTLARLSEGEAACSHLRALESAMAAKPKAGQGDPEKKIISAETLKEILHQAKIL